MPKALEPSFQSFLCFQNRERQNNKQTKKKKKKRQIERERKKNRLDQKKRVAKSWKERQNEEVTRNKDCKWVWFDHVG